MNHLTLHNQKIFNILNDPNKLEEKNRLFTDLSTIINKKLKLSEIQREYNKQYIHKTNIRSMVNKIKTYGKIRIENNKKYNLLCLFKIISINIVILDIIMR